MRTITCGAALLTMAMWLAAPPAEAAPCAPARIASSLDGMPDPWRAALLRLVAATSRPGRPWSCNGGSVDLLVLDMGRSARLAVTIDDWPRMERELPSPDDVVPVGEAMLARPMLRAASPAIADTPPAPERGAAPAPATPRGPRVLIDALAGPRFSGHFGAVWLGGALRVTIPIDAWALGLWARYEVDVAALQPTPVDFHAWSGSVGLSAGHRVLDAPLRLTASLEPSLAIVAMDGGPDDAGGVQGARGDFRIGARVQGALPLNERFQLVFALDGELSPQSIASAKHRTIDPSLPPMPSFSFGASVGGELAVR
jgi:hypothetical protein